jgi:hypothetical protein
MPCYEVRLVTVEFKAKNKDVLIEVLKEMDFQVDVRPTGEITLKKGWNTAGNIDLPKQTAEFKDAGIANEIKRKYAEKIIQQVALKKKWLFKQMEKNQIQLRRY